MAASTSHSVLCNAALASGLLSQQQIDDAVAGLAARNSGSAVAAEPISDEVLGQRLVDLGYLNRWQVEQLKEGRTKFNLGPYRIVNAIGQGGMGHVFKAEHKLLGRIEAIKVLPKAKSTPEAVAAFQREIRAQAQLDHPNLVRVSYADYEGDTYFFVTEYVPGTDLRKLVRRNGPLPFPIAATIISQAAEGLHYAHRRGLVHRDVKPGNLLVTPDGRTKMTDLGLAWFLMEELVGGAAGGQGEFAGGHGRLPGAGNDSAAGQDRAGERRVFAGLHAVLRGDGQGAVPGRQHGRQDSPASGRDSAQSAPLQSRFAAGFLRRDRGDDGQESGQAHADRGRGGGVAAAVAR